VLEGTGSVPSPSPHSGLRALLVGYHEDGAAVRRQGGYRFQRARARQADGLLRPLEQTVSPVTYTKGVSTKGVHWDDPSSSYRSASAIGPRTACSDIPATSGCAATSGRSRTSPTGSSRLTGRAAGDGHEDRDTVMITAPVIDLLDGPPSHEDRSGRVPFVDQFSGRAGRPADLPLWSEEPIMQPVEAVAARVARFLVWTGDVPLE
jgi:hypothetical protein